MLFVANYSHLNVKWISEGKKKGSLLPMLAHAGIVMGISLPVLVAFTTPLGALTLAAATFGITFGADFGEVTLKKVFPDAKGTTWESYIVGAALLAKVIFTFIVSTIA